MRTLSVLSSTLLIAASIAQQPPDPTVFQSQAREVLLEVVVRDAHGKLVTKVDPSQVTVYEDGVRQDIKSFRLVPGREARAENAKQMAQPAPTPADPGSAPAPAKRPVSNPLRTVNVVCLIMNDINPETRAFAFTAAKKFVDKELRPDTYIGVFTLDARGLRPVFPFSNSREHLMKAIELASVNQLATIAQSSAAVLNGLSLSTLGVSLSSNVSTAITATAGAPPPLSVTAPPPAGVPTAPDGSSVQDPLGARGDMGLSVNAGLREIDALIGLVKQLGQLPFQKTVLLMSTGLTRPPDQLEYWKSLITNANKGGVTFYGLDVYGLGVCQDQPTCPEGTTSAQGGSNAIQGSPVTTPTSASVALMQSTAGMSASQSTVGMPADRGPYASGGSSTQGPSPTAQAMESMHQTDYLRFAVLSANQQEALREISESTGGFVIANTNNSEALLTKVMEEVDTHYELAYQPASPSADGHFRKIEVKLNQPNLRVETRRGYYAVPETGEGPLTPGDMGALQALDTTPLPYDFGFETRAFRFRSAKGTAQYSIAWEIPIANLTATPEQQKKHRFHAYLFALVKNEQGDIVDRVSKDVPSDVADNYLAGLRSETMIYEHAVNLPPGRYTVETAVIDQEGNRCSTSVFSIDNREQPGMVGVSDIALVRRVNPIKRPVDPGDPFEIPGKRAQPFLSSELPAGTQPYIYFVVYPEQETLETPLLQAQFLKDGRVLSTQRAALPAADATGAIPMAIQTAAAPGDYEVKLTVEQGQKSAQRSLKYTIAAK